MGRDNASEQPNGQQQPEKEKPKEPSRYERTKKQRQELAKREADLANRERAIAEQHRQFQESQKPKRNYTLQELQKYRGEWENEGRFDLVEAADRELKAMQAEEAAKFQTQHLPVLGTPEHKVQWEQAEQELYQADPEFMRQGTRLDKALREIFQSQDGDLYRQHPRGIIAAYHRAKLGVMEQDVATLRDENSRLTDELKKYQGFTSVGGTGVTGSRPSGGRIETVGDFARLPRAEMRKHLLNNVGRGEPFI
jgi:hypothetical protein